YFWQYDCSKIIGNVDFCVTFYQDKKEIYEQESLLWAEAKTGSSDVYKSIAQLVLTIGKARTFDKHLPPAMLGAFDSEKIAFVPYSDIHEIFYQSDFNWNVTPSNYDTKEFKQIHKKVSEIIDEKALLFEYESDEKELIKFIKTNFVLGKFGITKTQIDKNNFITIYNKWLQSVKPTIDVNRDVDKKSGIIAGDLDLADLLSYEDETLKEKLFVLLRKDHYELDRKFDEMGLFSSKTTTFNDGQRAHNQFWNKYERPPREEYWDYIVERRDLLVPQDVRERKGSFFTPQIWVELSQKYIADVLGKDWQDEYYVWDCAAGTGNLLTGLTNKYNIWASTLDKQDVEVMKDRIKNGANLLESHVFQFDFLNDDFEKLPEPLFEIINNPKKRKKLVIYINPPYAEATSARKVTGTGDNRPGVAKLHAVNKLYKAKIGNASNEIFALFMARIYEKCPFSILAQFSTLKLVQGANFKKFRKFFLAKFLKGFVVMSNTFDNVKGKFAIGFTIWDLSKKEKISKIQCDVYEKSNMLLGKKSFYGNLPKSINNWLVNYYLNSNKLIVGTLSTRGNDFQNQQYIYLAYKIINNVHDTKVNINYANLIPICVYFSVRYCIKGTWLNNRDQFLYPNDSWEKDKEFQKDCLTFALFHGKNRISSKEGTNHWIPFTEQEVDAKEKFESNFMSNFIKGKINNNTIEPNDKPSIFEKPESSEEQSSKASPLVFSSEAEAVFDAGRELWRYYHSQPDCNANASLYDIREYFQGRSASGRMNSTSKDERYTQLIAKLRKKFNFLAKKIEVKVYEHGFLKE
ncbi:MAG: hypothetical protein GX121_01200, partial [Ignavibacteria bacterium]|nr:hypothetical protein [Ignavibacteria bacterium]